VGKALEAPLVPWEKVQLHTVSELAILTDASQLAYRINAPQARPQEDDLALILNTSGTTGKPKRVGLTHRMLLMLRFMMPKVTHYRRMIPRW
ncbi:Acyl-CoA synthetase family protein, partial [Lacticaseibacillus rhamnosus MTCC 5462]